MIADVGPLQGGDEKVIQRNIHCGSRKHLQKITSHTREFRQGSLIQIQCHVAVGLYNLSLSPIYIHEKVYFVHIDLTGFQARADRRFSGRFTQ